MESGRKSRCGEPAQGAAAAEAALRILCGACDNSRPDSWAGYLQKVRKTWREHPRPRTSLIPAALKATAPWSPPPHNAFQNGTCFGKPQLTPQSQSPAHAAVPVLGGRSHSTQTPRAPKEEVGGGGDSLLQTSITALLELGDPTGNPHSSVHKVGVGDALALRYCRNAAEAGCFSLLGAETSGQTLRGQPTLKDLGGRASPGPGMQPR
ncbi:hypothetical protein MG293_004114 [Ovis ammon polii]|uniref:Uncharacterized protein n=1 Tax=Ovis ammon polii TaxID=230172 RepID=A0AAD4UMN4_OVIAM|nr:hypothetical protein MG293_004114 [Ovis ammon polii]